MYLSLKEAAQITGQTQRQIRYLIQTGRITARKIKGVWCIARGELPLSAGKTRAARAKEARAATIVGRGPAEPSQADGDDKGLSMAGGDKNSPFQEAPSAASSPPDRTDQPAPQQWTASRGGYSVRTLRAVQAGLRIHRDLSDASGRESPPVLHLQEALALIACGCHAFDPREKRVLFGRAREEASRAVMLTLLLLPDHQGPADQIERELLPALNGLIKRAERRISR